MVLMAARSRGLLCAIAALTACTPVGLDFDFDQDGWDDALDCDPENPAVHPGADDPAGDQLDQDCDGVDGTDAPAVSIYPASPTTVDELFLQLTTEAPSWDVRWLLDGEALPQWRGQPSIPASVTARGQIWQANVTLFGSTGSPTASTEAETTIVNAPPSLSIVAGLPSSAHEGDVLTISVATSDPDSDSVEVVHEWLVDGSPVDGESGPELTSQYFDAGEVVTVRVTPTDGEDVGATLEANTCTVLNTPPSVEAVTVDPPSGTVETVFSCAPLGWSDPDPGDTETYTFEWYVDGLAGPPPTSWRPRPSPGERCCTASRPRPTAKGRGRPASAHRSSSAMLSPRSSRPRSPRRRRRRGIS